MDQNPSIYRCSDVRRTAANRHDVCEGTQAPFPRRGTTTTTTKLFETNTTDAKKLELHADEHAGDSWNACAGACPPACSQPNNSIASPNRRCVFAIDWCISVCVENAARERRVLAKSERRGAQRGEGGVEGRGGDDGGAYLSWLVLFVFLVVLLLIRRSIGSSAAESESIVRVLDGRGVALGAVQPHGAVYATEQNRQSAGQVA